MTHRYIGTKEVVAWHQDGGHKVTAGGPEVQPGYAVKYEDGYTSWSPKAPFEAAYRVAEGETQALAFGHALHFLKQGRRVARAGWNGKGMWLQIVSDWSGAIGEMLPGHRMLPFIGMKTADNGFVPWLASQTDMLNDDWCVLP